jgi:hypothetical protein
VRLVRVVEASVDEPETARFVKEPRVAVMRLVKSELKVPKIPLKPVADEVPVRVDEAAVSVPAVMVPRLALVLLRFVDDAVVAKAVVEVLFVVVAAVAVSDGVASDEVAMRVPVND